MKATSSRVKIIRKPNKEKRYREESCQLYANILLADKPFDLIFTFLIGHQSNSDVSPKVDVWAEKAEGPEKERQSEELPHWGCV